MRRRAEPAGAARPAPVSAARLARVRAPLAALGLLCGPAIRAAGDAAPTAGGPRVDAQRLPPPGSYSLPRLQACPDGEVLRSDGSRARLHALLRGRLSLVGFVYTYCRDPVGCPLAQRVMNDTREALLREPALAARSQLVSLSFDPHNDTPQQMRLYGGELANDPRLRWQFLTTASVRQLMPLLDGLGQDVSVETDAQGRPTRTLNHMLKLFLVDARLAVREIYSVATLDVAVLLGDLRTLAAERA